MNWLFVEIFGRFTWHDITFSEYFIVLRNICLNYSKLCLEIVIIIALTVSCAWVKDNLVGACGKLSLWMGLLSWVRYVCDAIALSFCLILSGLYLNKFRHELRWFSTYNFFTIMYNVEVCIILKFTEMKEMGTTWYFARLNSKTVINYWDWNYWLKLRYVGEFFLFYFSWTRLSPPITIISPVSSTKTNGNLLPSTSNLRGSRSWPFIFRDTLLWTILSPKSSGLSMIIVLRERDKIIELAWQRSLRLLGTAQKWDRFPQFHCCQCKNREQRFVFLCDTDTLWMHVCEFGLHRCFSMF